ncbi:hypothetical protein ABW20_dc0100084 [Dactylellina cionopaga]|nr:hypothetical protein ABW20_dc0100084 [Dactylellina cionopaga]
MEFGGLALGTSGAFALVNQCLTLYRHIQEAQSFGENVWTQYVLFQHERARLNSWYREMRDFHNSQAAGQFSEQMRAFNSTGDLDKPNTEEIMHHILAQILSVLGAIKILCEKYKVDKVEKSGNAGKSEGNSIPSISTGLSTTVIGSAIASDGKLAAYSLIKQQKEVLLRRNTGLFKRIMYGSKLWKESDKAELQQLVARFAQWNDCLQDFLPTTRRILLDLVSSSTILEGETDPSNLKRIHTAASTGLYESLARRAALRQANLESGLKPSFEQDIKCFDEKEIGEISSLLRGVATFSGPKPVKVLVEWKSYAELTDYDEIIVAKQHVEGLVKLLSFDKKPATMAVLDSLGYFQYEDRDHHLFGIISAMPPKSDTNQSPVSLNELLIDGTKRKRLYKLPSLPQRIGIAKRLAITLLELHNAEWLHKDLNSRNIIFFCGRQNILDYETAFVSGFEYSRPDDPSTVSFDVRNSMMDIYRHPSLLGPFPAYQGRPRYQRIHDIYSLGLLLLEIGLWRPVADFRKVNTKPKEFATILKHLADQELPHRIGPIYRDVVLKCIDGEELYTTNSNDGGGEHHGNMAHNVDKNSSLLKFYWSIIRELERCHCSQ